MSAGRPVLPIDEAIARRWKNTRLAASTSFKPEEVAFLDQVLAKLRGGQDVRGYARRPELAAIARKVESMKKALDRQRERRAAKAVLDAAEATERET